MTTQTDKPEFLLPQEVADLLRVELDTLAKWRWKQIGPPFIKIGRMVRYPRAGVEALLQPADTAEES